MTSTPSGARNLSIPRAARRLPPHIGSRAPSTTAWSGRVTCSISRRETEGSGSYQLTSSARRLDHTGWAYLMLDARYEKVRVDGRVVSQAVLVVMGFTQAGRREILDWRLADSESESSWSDVFRDLKDRGLLDTTLVVFLTALAIAEHVGQLMAQQGRLVAQIEHLAVRVGPRRAGILFVVGLA
mgnify:CR=1 FL=1